ncbi:MAG: putative Ig domain-containing protein, partial [Prosthecobacter sp.]
MQMAFHTYSFLLKPSRFLRVAWMIFIGCALQPLLAQEPEVIGVYHGMVSRTTEPPAWPNSHLGARLELTALANRTYTAKLISTGTPLSFNGIITVTDVGVGTSSTTIPRGSLPALTVDLSFADDQVTGTIMHTDGESATVSGWRNVWNANTRPATPYLGRQHFLMTTELSGAGTGFGSFTVPANGAVTVTGKLPDGSAFSTTTFVGPLGQVLIYQPLYTKPGSLIGALIVTPGVDGASATLASDALSWFKAPQTAPSDRFYKDGFLVNCEAIGGLYKAPAAGDVAVGLPDVSNNGAVSFTGLVESSETIPNSTFTLTSAAKLTMATGSLLNPAKTTLTLNPTTGLFSGGFTLVDQDFNTQIGTDLDGNAIYKKVTRAVKYEGLIVDDGITATAGGFYLAPNLPDTSAEPPTTLTTSLIEGGDVTIQPNPDAPPPLLIGFAEGSTSLFERDDAGVDIITSEPLAEARTLTVTVVPGTAVAADLSATSITVTIPAGSTGRSIRLPLKDDGLDEEDEDFRLVISDGAGFDLSEGVLTVTINDDDFPIEISADPQSQIIALGESAEFTVEAAGSDQTFQWQRNNTSLTGATSSPLQLANVQLAQAGTYRVLVSNAINTLTSGDAELAVVDTSTRLMALIPGANATFNAITAAPPESLSYEWQFAGSIVEDGTGPTPRITGATTAALTIRNLSDTDIGDYYCVITQNITGAVLSTGEYRLRLPTVKPNVADLDLPDGQILKAYHYDVLFDEGIESAPGSFSATGLPAGLSINANTGVISGTPTTPASNVRVVITATNPLGSTSVEDFIDILPFPVGSLGTVHGIVDRVILGPSTEIYSNPWDRADLGARIEILTTVTGGFSGKLINGTTLPFSGQLAFDGDFLVGTAVVKQLKKSLPPLYLDLSFDPTEQTFTGRLREIVESDPFDSDPPNPTSVAVWGWRNAWTKTAPATAYLGRFNFALGGDGGGIPESPQGAGYGSFVVPASGTFNISGFMPDGTAFICNTFLGPDGQIVLYQPLFKTPGSLLGAIQVKLATEEETGGPLPPGFDSPAPTVGVAPLGTDTPDGISCSWNKPYQSNLADKLYRFGFPVTNLAVSGGLYTPPESGQVVMDLPEVPLNAMLQFTGQVDGDPLQALTLTSTGKAVIPTGEDNPMKVTFTVNTTTGLFNGAFTKLDEDPNRPPLFDDNTGRLIRAQGYFSRSARYSGIIIPDSAAGIPGVSVGKGFFTISELPNTDLGITAANAQTLAGNLSLIRNPEALEPITIGFAEESFSLLESEPALLISVSLSEPLTTRRTVAISIQHRTTSAADFTLSSTSVVFEPGQTEAIFTLTLTPDNLDEQEEVFYLKLADGAGYNLSSGRMVCTIVDDDEAVQITSPPSSQLVSTGNPCSLGIEVTGTPPLTFQWRRDSVDIPGAIFSNYNIEATKLSDGGKYDVVISNRVGSITSPIANVAVMDSAEKFSPALAGANVSLALNINAPAGAVTYQWARVATSELVTDNARITGSGTKTLKINNISENDEGEYFCGVTLVGGLPGPALSLSSPYHWIVIVSEAPELIDLPPLTGAVAQAFTQPVEFQPGSNRRPASFSATNLPAGLTIDAVSGRLSGTPTVAVTDRSITITATNAIGSDSITTTITTTPLPVEIIGTFHGYVERNVGLSVPENSLEYLAPWPEAELGALFEMTTTATGSFSGKLTYAGTANSFTGAITDVEGILTARALIQRTGKPALIFACVMDASMPELAGAVGNTDPFSGNGSYVPMRAWRQVWTAANPATAYAGNYSFSINPSSDPGDRSPGGFGFATCTVPTNGAPFNIKGRLPDGSAFACSSLLGPRGEFVIYQALYTRLGSVLAPGRLATEPESAAGDPVFVESPPDGATLYKPVQTAAAETLYRNGIGPITLRLEGGRAVVTPAGSIVMGLADANDNASITFANTGSATPPDTVFRIRVGGATTMKTGIDFNPAKVAVTVKPATAEFSGSFTLTDSNPFNNALTLTRPAT